MLVLYILLGSWLVLRAVGALGIEALASWHASVPFALAAMFVCTGVSHFSPIKHEMARMVPRVFPKPMLMIYVTGVCELLGAVGLIIPQTRALTCGALIAMLIAMFPANVKAATDGLTIAGKRATPLWWRTPMQVLFIGLLIWAALR